MAKVFIGVGHGGSDAGASANGLKEKDLNLKQALYLRAELVRHGVIVGMSREKDENDPLADEIKEANAFGADYAIDLHTNAGGGDGWEAFYSIFQNQTGGKDLRLAQNIEAEVKAIGQGSRGCKTKKDPSTGRDYFGFIRELVAPSLILEMAFIDNWNDIKDFDEDHEIKKYAVAVAKGVLKTLGIAYKPEVVTPPPATGGTTYYRVVCGSYTSRANADKMVAELQSKGYKPFIDIFVK